jgi:tetratricopeptide (TPR) repeat protein
MTTTSRGSAAPTGSLGADRHVIELRSHRRLRGPYTAGGELLRRIVPELTHVPAEVMRPLATAVVAIAPDLEAGVPTRPQTLTDLADGDERTRFYPVQRTRDLAYMVSELLRLWAEHHHPEGVELRWFELEDADPTDVQLVATIRRRLDPFVVVIDAGTPYTPILGSTDEELAQAFIDADGTLRDPAPRAAYERLDETDRARRHSARAQLLLDRGEPAAYLGAIPYHLERGEDTREAVAWIVQAQNQTFREGFYDAALDLGRRGRALVPWTEDANTHNYMTKRVIGSLTYLSRCDEAMEVIVDHRLTTTEISEQMNDAYMMAMIHTRHLPPERIDQNAALAWVNTALAIAEGEPEPTRRAFYRAFMRNARALVELHRGNLQGSLELVEESIAIADDHLGDRHELHRTVLLTNRARVLLALGDHDGALRAFDEVLTRDPEYDDPHFERSVARKTTGDIAGAIADLTRAIELSVAFTDAYYNRADIWTDLGREDLALDDLTTLLDIDPDYVDARLNRAMLLMGLGELDAAAADIDHGLSLKPDSAELWSARGLLLSELDQDAEALASYDRALEHNPDFVEGYGNRAVLHFSAGRIAQAVADLDTAIGLRDEPALRVNRGIGRHELGDYAGAVADYDVALASDDVDHEDVADRRSSSVLALAESGASR